MIFVTVGTHEQPFNRLIQKVDELKRDGAIKDDVIIQTGFSTYEPKYCQWSKLIPYQQMVKNVADARIVITHGGLAAVSSSAFAALYSAFGKYDVVHIHAEGPSFFAWLPKMFGKRVVVTVHGIDWQREKWQSGLGSKFIHQGEKNAVKYADEVIVLSKQSIQS